MEEHVLGDSLVAQVHLHYLMEEEQLTNEIKKQEDFIKLKYKLM